MVSNACLSADSKPVSIRIAETATFKIFLRALTVDSVFSIIFKWKPNQQAGIIITQNKCNIDELDRRLVERPEELPDFISSK